MVVLALSVGAISVVVLLVLVVGTVLRLPGFRYSSARRTAPAPVAPVAELKPVRVAAVRVDLNQLERGA